MIKGGLAWLLWQGGVVVYVNSVASATVSGSIEEEEGEETVNTEQTKHHKT